MTYIIGWKHKQSVYISADSAVTFYAGNSAFKPKETSFGEAPHIDEEKIVAESALKIFTIKNKYILGHAGEINVAHDFARNLKYRLEGLKPTKSEDIIFAFKKSLLECHGNSQLRENQYIFGFQHNEVPYLYSYNLGNNEKIKEEMDLAQIGDISQFEFQDNAIKNCVKLGKKNDLLEDHFLVTVNAFMQSFGVHDYILEKGIGGAFYGVQLNPNGIKCQEPTTYLLYDNSLKHNDIINMCIVNNVKYVQSRTGDIAAITNIVNNPDLSFLENIRQTMNSDIYLYYVFINKEKRTTVILKRNKDIAKSSYLNVYFSGTSETKLELTPKFQNILNRALSKSTAMLQFLIDK